MLDALDRRILRQYQADPDLGAAELARLCDIPTATCWRRIERLEAEGIIAGRRAVIDWSRLGYTVEVSLRITLDKSQPRALDEFIAATRDLPQVLEVQTFLGRVDVRVSLIARDMAHYQRLYRAHILEWPHIADIEALMLVARVKTTSALPL